jgi:hypothetical protein
MSSCIFKLTSKFFYVDLTWGKPLWWIWSLGKSVPSRVLHCMFTDLEMREQTSSRPNWEERHAFGLTSLTLNESITIKPVFDNASPQNECPRTFRQILTGSNLTWCREILTKVHDFQVITFLFDFVGWHSNFCGQPVTQFSKHLKIFHNINNIFEWCYFLLRLEFTMFLPFFWPWLENLKMRHI